MAMDAQVTNTFDSLESIGNREELSNVITRIDPSDTPFYSNARKGTTVATLTEWQIQELSSAAATAQPEGFETTFIAATATVRHVNSCVILARSYSVSATLDAINTAGRVHETAYQKLLKGIELRTDVEIALTQNKAAKATDSREMAGYVTWMTNGVFGSSGSASTGDGTDLATTTGDQALTLADMDTVLQACYDDGGKPSVMMVTPSLKVAFSGLGTATGTVQNQFSQTEIKPSAYIGSISVYLSDFGRLDTVINRFMPTKMIFFIDPRHVEVATLKGRNFTASDLAKTGDAKKGHIVFEGTLRISAPKAHGIITNAT